MRAAKLIATTGLFIFLFSQAQAKEFTVGVEETEYYPYYRIENGAYADSYAKSVLDAFAKAHGHTFKYVPYPVNRLFQALINNEVDFKYPDNPVWQSKIKEGKNITYSDDVITFIDGVMVTEKNKGMTVDQIKTLGTITGFTPWPYFDAINSKKIALDEVSRAEGLLQKGIAGRVDGVFINVGVANYQLEKMGKSKELIFSKTLPSAEGATSLSTGKHADIIKEFNEFLKKEKVMIDGLKAKYKVVVEK